MSYQDKSGYWGLGEDLLNQYQLATIGASVGLSNQPGETSQATTNTDTPLAPTSPTLFQLS